MKCLLGDTIINLLHRNPNHGNQQSINCNCKNVQILTSFQYNIFLCPSNLKFLFFSAVAIKTTDESESTYICYQSN